MPPGEKIPGGLANERIHGMPVSVSFAISEFSDPWTPQANRRLPSRRSDRQSIDIGSLFHRPRQIILVIIKDTLVLISGSSPLAPVVVS